MNKIALNNVEIRPEDYIDRLPARGEKHAYEFDPDSRNAKADLIRRNLLSRKDLMLLYRPPIRSSAIPANNPFLTKSILHPPAPRQRNGQAGLSVDQVAQGFRAGSQRSPRSSTFYSNHEWMDGSPFPLSIQGAPGTAAARHRANQSTRNGGDAMSIHQNDQIMTPFSKVSTADGHRLHHTLNSGRT